MDRQPLDPESLAFLAMGCGIAAIILLAALAGLAILNRAAPLTFRDEPPFREGDGE